MTLLIPRAHASVACMGTASSRGLISQGDNRNTPLDALRIKEKKVFVKTLNTAFLLLFAHTPITHCWWKEVRLLDILLKIDSGFNSNLPSPARATVYHIIT